MTVIFFVFNCWSLTELIISLSLLNLYQPTQYSCSYTLKPNHLYSRNRNRGSISSWRRLFNRNENLRLSLTRYLAIVSFRERLKRYHFAALLLWSTFSLFTYTWRGRPSRHVRPPRLPEQESQNDSDLDFIKYWFACVFYYYRYMIRAKHKTGCYF